MSTLLFWLLIGWFALGAVCAIYLIGKPRSIYTPGDALLHVAISVGFILFIVFAWPGGAP